MQLHPMAEKALARMASWRMALHGIPEEGYQEKKTQAYLMRQLEAMRPDELRTIGLTGIKCVFRGRGATRCLAFRADMDGLSIPEATGLPFASRHPGYMHACGHDGHMAALLGLALCAAALRDGGFLTADVVLLFQPAEESNGGAARLIAEGALADPHVDEIYALHLFPDAEIGTYAVCAGAMMASDYEFDVEIDGKSAHAAMPQHGVNALDAANALYVRLKALPQLCDPTELALFNVGRMEGGERRNVVPGAAELQCVVRTYTEEALCDLRDRIRIAVEGTARAYDVVVTLKDRVYYPAVENPPRMVKRFQNALGDSVKAQKPLLIAEDFSYYQKEIPGLYYFVGIGDDLRRAPLHSDTFNFADDALAYALNAHLAVLFDRMAPAKESAS